MPRPAAGAIDRRPALVDAPACADGRRTCAVDHGANVRCDAAVRAVAGGVWASRRSLRATTGDPPDRAADDPRGRPRRGPVITTSGARRTPRSPSLRPGRETATTSGPVSATGRKDDGSSTTTPSAIGPNVGGSARARPMRRATRGRVAACRPAIAGRPSGSAAARLPPGHSRGRSATRASARIQVLRRAQAWRGGSTGSAPRPAPRRSVQSQVLQLAEQAAAGEVQVDRRDRDPPVDHGVEVRARDADPGRRRPADPVVRHAARVDPLDQLVLVDAPADARDLEPLALLDASRPGR